MCGKKTNHFTENGAESRVKFLEKLFFLIHVRTMLTSEEEMNTLQAVLPGVSTLW